MQGSSGFALLVSLLRYELEYAMTRVSRLDLQDMAQRYTSASSSSTASQLRYAGWPTIKTLLNRGLVDKTDARSAYYFLTDEGRKLAKNLALVSAQLKGLAPSWFLSFGCF